MSRIVSLIGKASNTSSLHNVFRANVKPSMNMLSIFQRNFAGNRFSDIDKDLDNDLEEFGDDEDNFQSRGRGRGRGRGGRNRGGFGGRRNDMDEFGGGRNDMDEFGGGRGRNQFGRGRGRNEFGGGRNDMDEFEGEGDNMDEFEGGRGRNQFGRGRGRNQFGGGRNDMDEFGGEGDNMDEFGGGRPQRNQRSFQRDGDRGRGRRQRNQDFENAEVSKNRLMISNLNFSATVDDIRKLVEPFGAVSDIQIPINIRNRELNRGFGFVTFEKEEDCEKAVNELNMSTFSQRPIKVFYAKLINRNRTNNVDNQD